VAMLMHELLPHCPAHLNPLCDEGFTKTMLIGRWSSGVGSWEYCGSNNLHQYSPTSPAHPPLLVIQLRRGRGASTWLTS
jgi:hypothetical protein